MSTPQPEFVSVIRDELRLVAERIGLAVSSLAASIVLAREPRGEAWQQASSLFVEQLVPEGRCLLLYRQPDGTIQACSVVEPDVFTQLVILREANSGGTQSLAVLLARLLVTEAADVYILPSDDLPF